MKALGYFVKVFCLCAILIKKRVTQHSTHNGFSHSCSLMACCRSSVCGDGAKRCEQEKERGGWGMEWERRISISLLPPPPYFLPVCDFAPHFTNCPEQASSLATSHIIMSNNIGFLLLLHLDFSFLYGNLFSPRNQSHKRVNADGFCTLVRNSWPQSSHRYVTRYSTNCQV